MVTEAETARAGWIRLRRSDPVREVPGSAGGILNRLTASNRENLMAPTRLRANPALHCRDGTEQTSESRSVFQDVSGPPAVRRPSVTPPSSAAAPQRPGQPVELQLQRLSPGSDLQHRPVSCGASGFMSCDRNFLDFCLLK